MVNNLVDVDISTFYIADFRPSRSNGVKVTLQPGCQYLECITISYCSVSKCSNL